MNIYPGKIINSQSFVRSKQDSLVIYPDVVEKLKYQRMEYSKISVMELFGIGYNTWRKIQSGQPIRRSVAERLLSRFDTRAAGQ